MAEQHAAFVGNVPLNYDRYLGPLLFHAYADEVAARLPVRPGLRVLEVASGTGIVTERLLPIPRGAFSGEPAKEGETPEPGRVVVDYLYEPAAPELFAALLPNHVEVQVYRALLESNAAFFAAQMTAMDAATRNSGEMIDQLTLYMNKVRQAAITREIIEVVSGAQAL